MSLPQPPQVVKFWTTADSKLGSLLDLAQDFADVIEFVHGGTKVNCRRAVDQPKLKAKLNGKTGSVVTLHSRMNFRVEGWQTSRCKNFGHGGKNRKLIEFKHLSQEDEKFIESTVAAMVERGYFEKGMVNTMQLRHVPMEEKVQSASTPLAYSYIVITLVFPDGTARDWIWACKQVGSLKDVVTDHTGKQRNVKAAVSRNKSCSATAAESAKKREKEKEQKRAEREKKKEEQKKKKEEEDEKEKQRKKAEKEKKKEENKKKKEEEHEKEKQLKKAEREKKKQQQKRKSDQDGEEPRKQARTVLVSSPGSSPSSDGLGSAVGYQQEPLVVPDDIYSASSSSFSAGSLSHTSLYFNRGSLVTVSLEAEDQAAAAVPIQPPAAFPPLPLILAPHSSPASLPLPLLPLPLLPSLILSQPHLVPEDSGDVGLQDFDSSSVDAMEALAAAATSARVAELHPPVPPN